MAINKHEQRPTESQALSPMASLRAVMPRLFGHGEHAKSDQPGWMFRKLWLWSIVSAAVLVIAGIVAHVRVGNALQVLLDDAEGKRGRSSLFCFTGGKRGHCTYR